MFALTHEENYILRYEKVICGQIECPNELQQVHAIPKNRESSPMTPHKPLTIRTYMRSQLHTCRGLIIPIDSPSGRKTGHQHRDYISSH